MNTLDNILRFLGIGFILCAFLFVLMLIFERKTITDQFTKKTNFWMAVDALKEGKVVRRKDGWKTFVKMDTTVNGKHEEVYGSINKGKFSPGTYLTIEDVLADDWIIED